MLRLIALLIAFASTLGAQEFSALARVDAAQSQLRDERGGLVLDLHLSLAVPYRVFTLDAPRRVVLDFREVDWQGASREALLNADNATDLRFGPLRPGWSRMVIDLAAPMAVLEAGMQVDTNTGRAHLLLALAPTDPEKFAQAAGAPVDQGWVDLLASDSTQIRPEVPDGPMIVAIDAGHGGIDPGAQRAGINEADLMLTLAFEVADAINRTGRMQAFLIREANVFVPLEQRMTRARAVGAVALISLHADSLEGGGARGASVYTLSETALDGASTRMAERHERGDLLAGLDLSGQDDRVASVLMDLARRETGPAGERLADALVRGMDGAGVRMNSQARRSGRFAVLNAPDFPSVLIEVGFLSSDADRAALISPAGRASVAAGIAAGLTVWVDAEAARAPLVRQ
jgi:N-acetylmuramoyl-L-alanine amidase